MLEKKIEEAVWRYAESRGVLQYKWSSPAHASVPDRLFILPDGFTFYIEFKRTGEGPTPAQAREHGRMRKNNATVYVVDNIPDGKARIEEEIAKMEVREWNAT